MVWELRVTAYTYDTSDWEVEAGGSELRASLGYRAKSLLIEK